MTYRFFVSGIPRPQGSKSFVRGRVIEASKYVGKWRKDVAEVARQVCTATPTEKPVWVDLTFTFQRPKSHVYASGDLKPGSNYAHISRPDVDKLSRAILDALTGVAYHDDSQVVTLTANKRYGDGNGVEVIVSEV